MTEWDNLLYITLISAVIGLIGLVWMNLSKKVDSKLDKELYKETMIHIQKGIDGISGTAQTLEGLAKSINNIQARFISRKDFEYEMRLHRSECRGSKDGMPSKDNG